MTSFLGRHQGCCRAGKAYRLPIVPYLEVTCRLLLVVVFAVAVFTKVSNRSAWQAFVQSLHQLGQLPEAAVRPAAIATVTTELLATLLLMVPVRAVGISGFVLSAGLLFAFTVVIGLAVARGNRTPCRCFGASSTPMGAPHLARNLLLVCLAALGLVATVTAGPIEIPYALLAGAGGLLVGILVTAAEDIVALLRPMGRAGSA